jgi:hypothetical protein
MIKRRAASLLGPDGIERPPEIERRINEAFTEIFNSASGTYALNYLKSITINAVAGPEQSDSALRHLEGGRFVVGLIKTRIDLGVQQRKGKADG